MDSKSSLSSDNQTQLHESDGSSSAPTSLSANPERSVGTGQTVPSQNTATTNETIPLTFPIQQLSVGEVGTGQGKLFSLFIFRYKCPIIEYNSGPGRK